VKIFLSLSLLLLVLVGQLCAQQKLKPRPGNSGVFGPAHTVKIERTKFTTINGQPVEGPRVLQTIIEYSEDGTAVHSQQYDPANGLLLNMIDETYDEGERLLETRFCNRDGTLSLRQTRTYDASHRLSEITSFRPNGARLSHTVYQYSPEQNVSETTTYDPNGLVTGRSTGKTSVVGERTPGEDLRESRTEAFSYNAAGAVRIQSSIKTNRDHSQEFRVEDSNGTSQRSVNKTIGNGQTEEIRYGSDGSILKRTRRTRELDSYGSLKQDLMSVAIGESETFVPTEAFYFTVTYYGKD
jgi:hypothetical protein